jgi:hypothetical protein
MKANKNFLCYCLIGVHRMLYKNTDCDHLDGLEAIMNSSDASLLSDIPDEIAKLSGHIVKKWWTSHGLPYVMDVFRVVPEVRVFVVHCYVCRSLLFWSCCRRELLTKVIPRSLEMALVLHRGLKRVPRLIIMAPEATVMLLLTL